MRALLVCLTIAGTAGSLHAQCLTDRLHAPANAAGGLYGYALALEGDFLAVGAPAEFGSSAPGQVVLYERNAAGGFDAVTVLQHPQASPFFGSGVAFSGGRLAVGDTGAGTFFFYEAQGGAWTALTETSPVTGLANLFYERPYIGGATPNYTFDGIYINGYVAVYRETATGTHELHQWMVGAIDEWLGLGLDFADGFLAVGSPGWGSVGEFPEPNHVTVWEYPADHSAPSVLAELHDPLGQSQARFGSAIALTDDRMAVGVGHADLARIETYRFVKPSLVFQHTGRIVPPGPQGSFYGRLALDGDTLLVPGRSSPGNDTVFHYEWDGAQWQLAGQLPLLGVAFPTTKAAAFDGTTAVFADFPKDVAWTWDIGGACPGLVAAPGTVSLAAGGKQDWLASFGPARAGDVYWVLGSATGTAPGVPVGAGVLPLMPDAWMAATIASANLGPFQANLGVLGAQGTGVGALAVPAGVDPALAGLVLHHAAVVLDAGNGTATAVSVPTEVTFVP